MHENLRPKEVERRPEIARPMDSGDNRPPDDQGDEWPDDARLPALSDEERDAIRRERSESAEGKEGARAETEGEPAAERDVKDVRSETKRESDANDSKKDEWSNEGRLPPLSDRERHELQRRMSDVD